MPAGKVQGWVARIPDSSLSAMPMEKSHEPDDHPQGSGQNTAMWYRTTRKTVVEHLRRHILRGEIRPGIRLLQAQPAGGLVISTTSVRETLWQFVGGGS